VLAVLSPTCPDCLAGYELLSRMSPTVSRLVLWTALKDGDSVSAVATLISGDQHFARYREDEGWLRLDKTTSAPWLGSLCFREQCLGRVSPVLPWNHLD
jgi:hypothetical protein